MTANTYRGLSIDLIRAHRITHIDGEPIPAEILNGTVTATASPEVAAWLDPSGALRDAGLMVVEDRPGHDAPASPTRDEHTPEQFETALAMYLEGAKELKAEYLAKIYTNTAPPKLEFSVMRGARFLRVVYEDGSSRSVYSFVEAATGDVYKPEGWKKPAKHVRSNIFSAKHGLEHHNWYGPEYLR
jgi:hypothetical protein